MRPFLAAAVAAAFCLQCLQRPADVPSPQRGLYAQGEKFMRNGRFREALDTFDSFSKRYPDSPLADDALFMAGFIMVSSAYGQRNYGAAIDYFIALEERYTASEWLEEARTWRKVLERVTYLELERPGGEDEPVPETDTGTGELKNALRRVRRQLAQMTDERDELKKENGKLKDVLKKLEALDR